MYCRLQCYPAPRLISYKIPGIRVLWGFVVPVSEVSTLAAQCPDLRHYVISSNPPTMTIQHRFTSWSVHPKGEREDREFFTSEHHALDVACDWSIERGGKAMVIECNDQAWMEVCY